jgi:heat shock protein HslJ
MQDRPSADPMPTGEHLPRVQRLNRMQPSALSAMTRVIAAAVVLFPLISCGEPGGPRPSARGTPKATSNDGTWELVQGRAPEGAIGISDRWRITLTIEGDRWGGLSACNHYDLSPDVDGTSISVTGLGGTEMGCRADVAETEARYHSALLASDTIERAGETLTLTGPESKLVYRFVPPPPTAELTDVRWKLKSLIRGDGPEAVASEAHPADLHFDADGTFRGSTGCRRLEGEWIEEGDRVRFTYFAADEGNCSDDLEEQNDAIIALGDGFTFEIDDDAMIAQGRFSDVRLQYRAAP